MSTFSAADVKRLRDETGAGFMDCKKALTEADGDFDKALDALKVRVQEKAAKRGVEREASNGAVVSKDGAILELKCETDFVAKNEKFLALADELLDVAIANKVTSAEELLQQQLLDGRAVTEGLAALAAVIGEKIAIGGVAVYDGTTTTYLHRRDPGLPPQVGVLIEYAGSDESAARTAAMQIAAMAPLYVSREDIPTEVVDAERKEAEDFARSEGKPEQILPRIVEGRLKKFYAERVLLEQTSVHDDKKTVGQVLEAAGVTVSRFARFVAAEPAGQQA
ncbi:translation elongation factor Ts [Tenggerimyces flavus]|uniref:Elongation factor Ts n=1 Tax=Tenggerimyces flavus TaxID=1708749 RepID=A0ABV7YI19_9ACTN|nr:translation elongation factor Ts [Tenggerimyces flavus]MBM7786800.1 elongation factor Ts [Tenggerimyces flavus]